MPGEAVGSLRHRAQPGCSGTSLKTRQLSSAFQAGQEGSRAGDRGLGRQQDSQARRFPKQEQREGHSSLSPPGKAQSPGHAGQ